MSLVLVVVSFESSCSSAAPLVLPVLMRFTIALGLRWRDMLRSVKRGQCPDRFVMVNVRATVGTSWGGCEGKLC